MEAGTKCRECSCSPTTGLPRHAAKSCLFWHCLAVPQAAAQRRSRMPPAPRTKADYAATRLIRPTDAPSWAQHGALLKTGSRRWSGLAAGQIRNRPRFLHAAWETQRLVRQEQWSRVTFQNKPPTLIEIISPPIHS